MPDVIFHIIVSRMESTDTLIAEMEAAASALGIQPSTVGERAGQGGRFYARLKSGARVWPETATKVRAWIEANASRGSVETQEG